VTVVVHRPEAHFPRREKTESERDRERERAELKDKLISSSRLCSGHNA
jgi:hypothetical protein